MDNLINLMYIQGSWLIDREYPYFHIAINHPKVNGVQKEVWQR